ncbi:MAG: MBOAT family O-acyltransferase, partial [Planctomycetota bacterium]
RYNRVVGDWLHRNVFLPAGGRRRIWLAVPLTFLVSGVLHEYLFDAALGRIHCYQLAFFAVQALGVAASIPVEHRRRRLAPALRHALRAATLIFVWASSALFFASLDSVLPAFYAAEVPLP